MLLFFVIINLLQKKSEKENLKWDLFCQEGPAGAWTRTFSKTFWSYCKRNEV